MPRTPKYSASKGRACYDVYIILYGAEPFTLQLQITFTLQMCFNAAMQACSKRGGWQEHGVEASQICFRFRKRTNIGPQTEEVHYLQLTAGETFWIDRQRSQCELKPSLYRSATRNYLVHLLEENDRTTVL